MAAAVVDLLHLPRGVLVRDQEGANGLVEGVGQGLGLGVVDPEVRERARKCQVLAQGVPAEVAFLDKLLHVLGRRTTSTSLVHGTACEHGHYGEHLRGGAELQDGEEVGQVVPQHIASHRDGVQAVPGALAGYARGLHRRHDLDVQTLRTELWQILLDLLHQDHVVRASRVEPEDRLARLVIVREVVGAAPVHRQFNPILDGSILRLA
mmetsp:Transcript_125546/g.340886  ORF Transcript_125546/g.340886 Transcript_125546/m.340886 type:complete len:208 (+) Transcript_125546:715-1338(+)